MHIKILFSALFREVTFAFSDSSAVGRLRLIYTLVVAVYTLHEQAASFELGHYETLTFFSQRAILVSP
jgi:hypothetical protein